MIYKCSEFNDLLFLLDDFLKNKSLVFYAKDWCFFYLIQ